MMRREMQRWLPTLSRWQRRRTKITSPRLVWVFVKYLVHEQDLPRVLEMRFFESPNIWPFLLGYKNVCFVDVLECFERT